MDEETKNVISYINNELQMVHVRGTENIMHMANALINIGQLLQKPIDKPTDNVEEAADKQQEEKK